MKRVLWLAGAALLAVFSPQVAAQEYHPTHYLVLVSPPDAPSVILSCDEDTEAEGIPGRPDIEALNAAGQWFIGLDLGAHQATYKLVCSST